MQLQSDNDVNTPPMIKKCFITVPSTPTPRQRNVIHNASEKSIRNHKQPKVIFTNFYYSLRT